KSDTLNVQVRGDTKQDIKVKPYYIIQNAQFSASGRTVSASFSLKQIIDNSAVQYVALYVGKTRFANGQKNIVSQTIGGSQIANMDNIELSAEVPKLSPTQNYVFAHIGVKIQNVEDLLFSKVK